MSTVQNRNTKGSAAALPFSCKKRPMVSIGLFCFTATLGCEGIAWRQGFPNAGLPCR